MKACESACISYVLFYYLVLIIVSVFLKKQQYMNNRILSKTEAAEYFPSAWEQEHIKLRINRVLWSYEASVLHDVLFTATENHNLRSVLITTKRQQSHASLNHSILKMGFARLASYIIHVGQVFWLLYLASLFQIHSPCSMAFVKFGSWRI